MKIVQSFFAIYILFNIAKCLQGVNNLSRNKLSYYQNKHQDRSLASGDSNQDKFTTVNHEVKVKKNSQDVSQNSKAEDDEDEAEKLKREEEERLKKEEEERLKRIEELKVKQKELQEASEIAKVIQVNDLLTAEQMMKDQAKNQISINFQPDLQNAQLQEQNLNIKQEQDESNIQIQESGHNNPLPEDTLKGQKFDYVLSNYQWYKNDQDNKVYVALPISWQVFVDDHFPQTKLIYKLGLHQNFDSEKIEDSNNVQGHYVDTSELEKLNSKFCSLENVKQFVDKESDKHFLYGLVSQESFSNNLQIGEIFTRPPEDNQVFLNDDYFANYKNLIVLLLFVLKVQLGISGLDSSNTCNAEFVKSIADQVKSEIAIVSGESEEKINIKYSECKQATEFRENPHITDIFDIQHLLIPIEQNSDIQTGKPILEHLKDIKFDYSIFFQNIAEAPLLQYLSSYDIQINYRILQLKKLFYNEETIKILQDQMSKQSEVLGELEEIKKKEVDELNQQFQELELENPFTLESQEVLYQSNEKLTQEQRDILNMKHFTLGDSFNTYLKKQQEMFTSNQSTIESIKTRKIFQKKPQQKIKLIQLVQLVENFMKYAKQYLYPSLEKEKCYGLVELKQQSIDCPEPLALCNMKFMQDLGKKNIDQKLFKDLIFFKFDQDVDLSKYYEIMHLYLLKLYQCQFTASKAQKEFQERPLFKREQNHKNLGLKQKNYFENVFSIDSIFSFADIQYARELKLEPETKIEIDDRILI